MNYFLFRNSTLEPLFSNLDVKFSGYDDISDFESGADNYIWFYVVLFNPDIDSQINEIDHYFNKIDYLRGTIPASKNFIVFTLLDLFSVKWENSDFRLKNKIFEFNQKILKLSQEQSNIKIIDLADFTKSFSEGNIINWKYFYTSLMFINPALSEKFQIWFCQKTEAILLKRKKCIILDLDNTIWGGVLGEDGIEGIQLGNTYPGNCFLDFQRILVQLSKAGVILAICSKNNEKDVIEAFNVNPNMLLKLSHIVAYKVNWINKPANIKELANEINIGLDSFVFLDDSPVERELVKKTIPEVCVPEFPKEPYNIIPFFKSVLDDYFQIYKLTNEDFVKATQYKENYQRDNYMSEFSSIDDYLENLDIEILIKKADKFNISRIAQMTQKTNQFNLTTKRYSETEITHFIERGDLVLCSSVKDKFGDNGITILAIIFLDTTNSSATIDSFLLSCRILGRGVESAFLNYILNILYKKGIRKIESNYIATPKNDQARTFYEKNGFKIVHETADSIKYTFELVNELSIKSFYKIIYEEL